MKGYTYVALESKLSIKTVSSFNPFIIMSQQDNYDEPAIYSPTINHDSSRNISEENHSNENLIEIGNKGEKVAEAYLKTIYEQVESVAHIREKGYDIKADSLIFKVKTTTKNIVNRNEFQISRNELDVAYKYKSEHRLMFIKLLGDTEAIGYIIKDMFAEFDINWPDVKTDVRKKGVKITAENYKFVMDNDYLNKFTCINLAEFIPIETEE